MSEPKEPKKVEEEKQEVEAEECELSDEELDAVAGAGDRERRDDSGLQGELRAGDEEPRS